MLISEIKELDKSLQDNDVVEMQSGFSSFRVNFARIYSWIKNKLNLSQVAYTGKFSDLKGVPSLPTKSYIDGQDAAAIEASKHYTDDRLQFKVDREVGKGLSTNDFRDSDVTKLGTIQTGATKNETDEYLLNRANHYGPIYVDPGDIQLFPATTTTTGVVQVGDGLSVTEEGILSADISGNVVEDIYDSLDNKVDKVAGKQLSTEDYTTSEKDKLSGVAPEATKNASDADLRDRATHTGTQAINTVEGLESALEGKASVGDVTELEESLADVATSGEYDDLSGKPNLSVYATTTYVDDSIGAIELDASEIKSLYESNANTNAFTDSEKNKLGGIESGAEVNVPTNLSATRTANQVTITNDNGTNAVIGQATSTQAGVLSSSDKAKIDGLSAVASTGDYGDLLNTPTSTDDIPEGSVNKYITQAEKEKLSGLEGSHFKGQFVSLSALNTAFPTADVGDYAYVDLGEDEAVVSYLWDESDEQWTQVQGAATELTPAQIKSLYESNPDTNGYTDAEKSKLSGIEANATENSSDASLRDRSTHTGTQSANTITGLADVATSGDYDDLDNLPTLFSGNYNDLSNKPTIPDAQVNSDWNATNGVAQILNKPTLGSAASADSIDFATSAQGAKADTAIQSIVAGTNITVDDTDPLNPIVSATGGGGSSGDMQSSVYDPNGVEADVFDILNSYMPYGPRVSVSGEYYLPTVTNPTSGEITGGLRTDNTLNAPTSSSAHNLVMRDSTGQIQTVLTPTNAEHVTSKKYVDDAVASAGGGGGASGHSLIVTDDSGDILVSDGTGLTGVNSIRSADAGNDKAIGDESVAIGYSSYAIAERSLALGVDSWAGTMRSTAVGENTYIDGGTRSVAIGAAAYIQDANNSIAIGGSSGIEIEGSGYGSVGIGGSSFVSKTLGTAIGYSSAVGHENSVALGANAVTTKVFQVSVGNPDREETRLISNVSTPVDSTDAATKGYVDTAIANAGGGSSGYTLISRDNSGNIAEVGDTAFAGTGVVRSSNAYTSFAVGDYSTAIGYNASASGSNSTSIGYNAAATETSSTAIGYNASASGSSSTVVGRSAGVSGNYSTAIGYNAFASEIGSTAIGYNAYASETGSIAIGRSSQASGSNSTSIGYNAAATETGSTAIGYNSGRYKPSSTARTVKTTLGYNASYTRDDSTYEVAIGRRTADGGTLTPTLLTGVADPEQPNDAANKQYVDATDAATKGYVDGSFLEKKSPASGSEVNVAWDGPSLVVKSGPTLPTSHSVAYMGGYGFRVDSGSTYPTDSASAAAYVEGSYSYLYSQGGASYVYLETDGGDGSEEVKLTLSGNLFADKPIQYKSSVAISDDNDLVTKQYVDTLLSPAQRTAINALVAGTSTLEDLINALQAT